MARGKRRCFTPFSVSISAMTGPLEPQSREQVSKFELTFEYLQQLVTSKSYHTH